MKLSIAILLFLATIATAQVPTHTWQVETAQRPAPYALEIIRGESITLAPQYVNNGVALSLQAATNTVLRYRSADMPADSYYALSGTTTGGTATFAWGSTNCAGPTNYSYTIAISGAGVNLRSYGTIKLIGSVGGISAALPTNATFDTAAYAYLGVFPPSVIPTTESTLPTGSIVATNQGVAGQSFFFSSGAPTGVSTGYFATASGSGDMLAAVYDTAGGARQVAFGDDLAFETNRAKVAESALYPRSNPSNYITLAQVPAQTQQLYAAQAGTAQVSVVAQSMPWSGLTGAAPKLAAVTNADTVTTLTSAQIAAAGGVTNGTTATLTGVKTPSSMGGWLISSGNATCITWGAGGGCNITLHDGTTVNGALTATGGGNVLTNGGATLTAGTDIGLSSTSLSNGANITISYIGTGGGSTGGISAATATGIAYAVTAEWATTGTASKATTVTGAQSDIIAAALTNAAAFATAAQGIAGTNAQARVGIVETNYVSLGVYNAGTNQAVIAATQRVAAVGYLLPASTQGLATVTMLGTATNAAIIDATNRVAGVGYLLPASTQGLATVAQVTAATNAIDATFIASKGGALTADVSFAAAPACHQLTLTNTSPLSWTNTWMPTSKVSRVTLTSTGTTTFVWNWPTQQDAGMRFALDMTGMPSVVFPAGAIYLVNGVFTNTAPSLFKSNYVSVIHDCNTYQIMAITNTLGTWGTP